MANQLEQYYMWRVVTFAAFVTIFAAWFYIPQFMKLGFPALTFALVLAMLGIYYFQYKSGYDPRGYYRGVPPKHGGLITRYIYPE